MKVQLKKTLLLATSLLIGGQLLAQLTNGNTFVEPFAPNTDFRTWSIGINGGALSSYTIFHGKDDWNTADVNLGYGVYVKKQILHSFGIQTNFFMGQLSGSGNSIAGSPFVRYNTNINYAADLSAVIMLANINWGSKQSVIQPYITAGGGFTGYLPSVYNVAGIKSYPVKNGNNVSEFYIPVGAGLKFNISSGINIDLGYQVNFVNNDNIDGNITGTTFDKFSYSHIGLEFALGKSSKPQLATHNPVAAMRAEYMGQEASLQNIIEVEKSKNAQLRSDLSLTNSSLNATIDNLNAVNAKLSTDSDGDGVPDLFDKCPNTPKDTKVDGAGCPLPVSKSVTIINETDKKIVKDAIANLEFYTGSSVLRQTSLPSLDKVAELLVTKGFSLKLAGHTDNVGPDDINMMLSKNRAEAVKSYLVVRGANPSRIEATGYGKTQPIATNKTPEGRQQNRRVEFTLF